MSMREAILIALALAGVYLLFSLLRLAQLRLRQRWAKRAGQRQEPVAHAVPEPLANVAYVQEPSGVRGGFSVATNGKVAIGPAEMSAVPAAFEDQLFRSSVEAELQQLRSEVAALKETLVQLKASRRVSPQYSEAMLLAQRGLDAHEIAEQCAISIGEAELVLALSRNKLETSDYDSEYERFERNERGEQRDSSGQGGSFGH